MKIAALVLIALFFFGCTTTPNAPIAPAPIDQNQNSQAIATQESLATPIEPVEPIQAIKNPGVVPIQSTSQTDFFSQIDQIVEQELAKQK